MESTFRQIIDLARGEPGRTRWILVSSEALGHTLAERLVRSGVCWANLRFTTPLGLAKRIAGPRLAREGLTPLDPQIGPALVLELLLALPDSVPRYFREIGEQPGVADALWSAIRDLRLAGVTAGSLPAGAFSGLAKHGELSALLAAYERRLRSSKLADDADFYAAATGQRPTPVVLAGDHLLEMPGTCDSALARTFIDSLRAGRVPARLTDYPGLRVPADFERRNGAIERLAVPGEPPQDSGRLAWIAEPAAAPGPLGDGSLAIFSAAGREAEVEEVLRRIHTQALPLDSVEIICAQPDAYGPLLWEKAARYDFPITLESGIPGTLTRPVRALLGLCGWIASNFAAVRLSRMLDSGVVVPGNDDVVTPTAAARLLRAAGATVGRAGYAAVLETYAARSESLSKDEDLDGDGHAYYVRRAEQARALAAWIAALLDSIPEPAGDSTVQLGTMLDALIAFLKTSTSVGGKLDMEARVAAQAALESLSPLRELVRPLHFQLALIRNSLESITVAQRPQPGALHVSPLSAAGMSGRTATFVIGLEEGAVFPSAVEHPVLLDCERARIGRLQLSTERVDDISFRCIGRLAGLFGRVTLSYSCRELRQGRQSYPSWLLFHAHQLLQPGTGRKLDDLLQFMGEPVTLASAPAGNAMSDTGWWLAKLRRVGPAAMPALAAAFPGIARGMVAERERASGAFTDFDGRVPIAGLDLDPARIDVVSSASRLEEFAICPFRYFLRTGLGLQPAEDEEPDPDIWLDPQARGEFLHHIYSAFLRELRSEVRRPRADDWVLLERLASGRLEAMRQETPPPSAAVYESELVQIHRDLRLFLNLEIARAGVDPVGIEVPFGFDEVDPAEPLSRREPVIIHIGPAGSIRLRGRIDRIDRRPGGSFEVIDYKTGGLWREHFDPPFDKGRLLQHALYAEAARQLLSKIDPAPRVAASSYYFCTEREWGEWVCKPGDADARPVLAALAEALRSGAFLRGEKPRCQFCDYHRVCPPDDAGAADTKRAGHAPGIAALRSLAGYE